MMHRNNNLYTCKDLSMEKRCFLNINKIKNNKKSIIIINSDKKSEKVKLLGDRNFDLQL